MDDIDPLDSDEFDAVTPAQGGSPATGSPRRTLKSFVANSDNAGSGSINTDAF